MAPVPVPSWAMLRVLTKVAGVVVTLSVPTPWMLPLSITVTRVVFFATPHQGSDMSASRVGRLAALVAGVPGELMHVTEEVAKHNPHLKRSECRLSPSVDMMMPEAP